jgi:hypothetical protein
VDELGELPADLECGEGLLDIDFCKLFLLKPIEVKEWDGLKGFSVVVLIFPPIEETDLEDVAGVSL